MTELNKNIDPNILHEESLRLSEEIADLSEIFSEEKIPNKARKKMTERVRDLGERRDQIRMALNS